MACGSFY
jgi:hypothetical protein